MNQLLGIQFEVIVLIKNLNVMKKLNSITVNLLLAISFCLISFNGQSQEVRLNKEQKRDVRNAELGFNYRIIDSLLFNRSFVLKADYLENQYGDREYVPPTLNFIRVDSSHAVIQTGANTNLGYNGVGGVTAEGRILNYKLASNAKSLRFNLRFSVITNIGTYDVSMDISSDNNVRATISGLTRDKLIYNGHLEDGTGSRVYKGLSL